MVKLSFSRPRTTIANGIYTRTKTPTWIQIWVFILLLTLSDFLTLKSQAAEFNYQLMKRVVERVDDFMQDPVSGSKLLLRHRNSLSFDHGLTAPDYEAVLNDVWDVMTEAESSGFPFSISIALEDGTYISYSFDLNYSIFREPGNDGYDITNIQQNNTNYKNWISCFNSTNGKPSNCSMNIGMQYIECVNDCELVPCTSEMDDQQLNASGSPSTLNNTNGNQTIWCRNYVTKSVTEEDQRGYIPTAYKCINEFGKVEQRPGLVLTDYKSQTMGNCYYEDRKTLVSRSIVADFAVCGVKGQQCDIASKGNFKQLQFDARYRDWYVEVKQKQRSLWHKPYVAIRNKLMVITYGIPLYSLPRRKNETLDTAQKQTFEGIIVADYNFGMINEFLIKEFSNTEMQVIIVERDEPNYLIAASNSQTKVLKMVLISNSTVSCPDDRQADLEWCVSARVAISELSDSMSVGDVLLNRAYRQYQQMGYPVQQELNIKESDKVGSQAFVSQGSLFQLPGSDTMDWDVLVLLPMPRSTHDSSLPGDISFAIVMFLGCLGLVGCFWLCMVFLSKRHEKAIIHADWRFTSAFIMGCSLLNGSSLLLLGPNTNAMCMLRMWSFNLLFSCSLSPLFVKVWRMAQLLNASKGFKRQTISHFKAFLMTLPLVFVQMIILLVFTFVDPPRQTEYLGVGFGVGEQMIICTQKTNAFLITQFVFHGFLIGIGCILAYKTRDLDPKFGEAKQLAFSMYNLAFTGLVVSFASTFAEMDQESQIILQTIGVFWGTIFCSFSFVLPRLLEVNKDTKKRISTQTNSGDVATSSNVETGNDIAASDVVLDRSGIIAATMNNSKAVDHEITNILSSMYDNKPLGDQDIALTSVCAELRSDQSNCKPLELEEKNVLTQE